MEEQIIGRMDVRGEGKAWLLQAFFLQLNLSFLDSLFFASQEPQHTLYH
jgi:hypothetical protein